MKSSRAFMATAAVALLPSSLAQAGAAVQYTDPSSNITFDTWSVPDDTTTGGLTFGLVLPDGSLTSDATEFIGYLQCSSQNATATGWCGMSFGGSMTNSLLLLAYPHGDEVLTSFRYVGDYALPPVYEGDAKLTQVSSAVNATHYSVAFRCEGCLHWEGPSGAAGNASTSAGTLVLGWAQAFAAPGGPECADTAAIRRHDNGQGVLGAQLDASAANPSYSDWAAKATKTVTGECTAAPATTPATTPATATPATMAAPTASSRVLRYRPRAVM